MALPTDPAESFVREVDENLRRDQAQDFLKKNGPWIIGAVLLFLAAVAGYLYWQDRQLKASEADTEKLNEVMMEIGGGQIATAEKDLPALQGSKSQGISAAARLTHAALLLDKSDRKAAMDEYRAVANDKDLAGMLRMLAPHFQPGLPPLVPEERCGCWRSASGRRPAGTAARLPSGRHSARPSLVGPDTCGRRTPFRRRRLWTQTAPAS